MAKTCPSCKSDLTAFQRGSAWTPLLTALGLGAAAYLVYRQIQRNAPEARVESALEACARAAQALDRRLDPTAVALAG